MQETSSEAFQGLRPLSMLQRLRRRVPGTTVVMWLIGLLILAVVAWGTIRTLVGGKYSGADWLGLTVYGVSQGSIYALVALGYTLAYGILRMINFAHSQVFMVGPFIGYFVATALANAGMFEENWILALFVVLLVAMVVSASVAVLLERIAYRPLRRAPRLVLNITAIGASLFLQYTFLGLFGSDIKVYPGIPVLRAMTTIPGTDTGILNAHFLVIVAAMVFLAMLYILVQRTKAGKAMQAVSEDRDTAALMGIDIDRIIVITFVVSGALAGAAGIFYVLLFGKVHFFTGFYPGLNALIAAVLGGMGNVLGAMLGGMFLGIAESLFPSLVLDGLGIPAPYQLRDTLSFVLFILVLIFRPTGILGERLAAKKP